MPSRILREGILTSERVATLNWAEEVFYRRLMSVVDDYGRYTANTKLIRAACYPLIIDKVSDADVGKWMAKCAEAALVSVYPATDGKRYLQISNFRQQTRTTVSKYPAMSGECAAKSSESAAPASHPCTDASHPCTSYGVGDEDVIGDVVGLSQAQAPQKPGGAFVLPDWINESHWDAWREHPKLKKATDKQKAIAVEKLEKWRNAGEDFAGALENAAASGYQGLFLPDNKNTTTSETAYQKSMRLRVAEFAPSIARQAPGAPYPLENMTLEASNVTAITRA